MKFIIKWFTPLLFLVLFIGCKKDTPARITGPDYSENYKFFPIKDGREWNYELTIEDKLQGTYNIGIEKGRYSQDSQCINYFRSGILNSNAFWANFSNKMGCCGDMILIDYNQFGCSSDSVLIYQKKSASIDLHIFQYCDKKFASEVSNYNKTECIKTRQLNTFPSGNSLEIINYFGYNIGLIYRRETSFDSTGKIRTQQTQKLISTNF